MKLIPMPVIFAWFLTSCGNTVEVSQTESTVYLNEIDTIMAVMAPEKNITKIAFGSCGHEDHELPIFDVIASHEPDLFIFLGDNIYGDTRNMKVLQSKYDQLGNKPSYQNLKSKTEIIATWDDHDYGENDAGRHYPMKAESKEIFLDFFGEPENSARRQHEGIYTSYLYKTHDKILQIILLDTRTFRDNLKPYNGEFDFDQRYFYEMDYAPYQNDDSTLLGEAQWKWLETELHKPADLRLICSGTQFGIEYNGYESWANFPVERTRMVQLIQNANANGVLFLTGDVHYAEISKFELLGCYPLYDVTASGLSSTWHFATPNENRIEGPVMENHFGLLTFDWEAADPTVTMEIWDVNDSLRISHQIHLTEISF